MSGRDSPALPETDPLLGWRGHALALAWGLAEGTFFFLVPDLLFTLTATRSPRRGLVQVGMVILGALLAGLALHTWAAHNPARARSAVGTVPFVTGAMFDQVEKDYARDGWLAPLDGPFSGIPYKVYAVAGVGRSSLPAFLLVSVPARAERLLLTWTQFALLGAALRRWTRRPAVWSALVYSAYWLITYAVYWSSK